MIQGDARDMILGHAKASLPNDFVIAYADLPAVTDPKEWARVTVKHAGRHQRGFGDGIKKYVAYGVLCIEVFTQQGDGLTEGDKISGASVLYLENIRSSPIWYRNIRAIDIGQDGGFSKINVYADFEYEHHH